MTYRCPVPADILRIFRNKGGTEIPTGHTVYYTLRVGVLCTTRYAKNDSCGFDVPVFEDVDMEFKRVVEAGAKPVLSPVTEPWGQRTSYVADPEGNLIEIGSFGVQETES